ncbi:MAG TPA: lipocalin-like domain-containing protein [Longimicrobiales bacterium]|nr:lipocalin-like domain-containing protein [Longimicrobiales bacterium]
MSVGRGAGAGVSRIMPAALLATALISAVSGCGRDDAGTSAVLSLTETLGGADTVGYARAVDPRPFTFPLDHGPHPDFRNEWWYVTGNLADSSGRNVGFQLTLFRSSLAPAAPETKSAWATNQAWMGHFAVTDEQGGRFRSFQRFARGAVGLAGAEPDPLNVWVEDWSLRGDGPGVPWPLRLRAADGEVALDLVLDPGKPAVLQGDGGLSRKGPEPGNASYYYSFTRMPTRGQVVLEADTLQVVGASWLDREWSTSALPQGVDGWDWFALQLDNGWELMVYALRRADGSAHPLSDGVLVDPSGGRHPLAYGTDIVVLPTDTWTSPLDGSLYPSGWTVTLPGRRWSLEVQPVLENQELDLAFRYWEGAVAVSGTDGDRALGGRGYVELTGYAGSRPER